MVEDNIAISETVPERPKWWDEQNVPHYADFDPSLIANIDAQETVLVEIACSQCSDKFQVAISSARGSATPGGSNAAEGIEDGETDHPYPFKCVNCDSGTSTEWYCLRIVQYWSRVNQDHVWVRDSRFEIDLPELVPRQVGSLLPRFPLH